MNIRNLLTKLKNGVLDAVFPNGFCCIFCGVDIPEGDVCTACQKLDIFNTSNRCTICDTPIKDGNIICDHCKTNKRAFHKAYCPLLYEGNVRSSILKLKSDGAKYLAAPFARLIYNRLQEEKVDFDIIVPVPSHSKTIKKRGYNPTKVLADELSKLCGKQVCDVLVKTTLTKNQKFLNFSERQTNLENTLTLADSKAIKGKVVLLVDDIITTGATINACAALLHKANKVYACAVARRSI